MKPKLLAATLLLGAALLAQPSHAEQIIAMHSPKGDMPSSDLMFPGPGADEINNNCITCHSADHVLNQPSLSKAAWAEVVAKMIDAYKAPIDADDASRIVDYLARTKGKP
jgi:hypothetical protein